MGSVVEDGAGTVGGVEDCENTAASWDTGRELVMVSFLTGGAEDISVSVVRGGVSDPDTARMVITVPCEDWTLTGGQMN